MRNVSRKGQAKVSQGSPAGVAVNKQQQRGRGRPPGSGKRVSPTNSGVLSAGVSKVEAPPSSSSSSRSTGKGCSSGSQSDAPVGSKRKLKRSASSTCSMGGEEDSRNEDHSGVDANTSNDDGSGSSGEGAKMSVDDDTVDVEGSERDGRAKSPDEVFEPGAPGISAALAVISRAGVTSGKVDGGPWTESELDILEQVRAWAPLQDIQSAYADLLAQKEMLIKRILAVNPLFDAKDLEEVVAAQLKALASAQKESAALDTVTTVSATGSQSGAATPAPPKPKRSKPKPKAAPVTANTSAHSVPSSTPSKKLSLSNITSATILPAPALSSIPSQEGGSIPVLQETTATATATPALEPHTSNN